MIECHLAWRSYAVLQKQADPQSIDRSLARDEALDAVLNEVLTEVVRDEERLRKRFHSLCHNRLSKQNHRRALDRQHFCATDRRGANNVGSVLLSPPARWVFDQVAYGQLIDLLRTVLPEEEFWLLLEIADGDSYANIARNRKITVSSLKSKAFRIREKVRNSRISATLYCALRR
jgi:hypothetical protein